MIPDLKTLQQARERIAPFIHQTPVLKSKYFNDRVGAEIYFKCENFQKVGAFKARGGFNAILSMTEEERKNGVTAHSSGNHAQAVAIAARTVGIPAYIVMPKNAPKVKVAAVKAYGAEVITCEPTLDARENTVEKIIEEKGAELIHPYNNYRIIAGQASCAMELLEQTDDLDYVFAPIGGGGLISGTALAIKYLSPKTRVIGGEPENADEAYRSFQAGKLLGHESNPESIADGLLAAIGDKNFEIIEKEISDIHLVSEEEIVDTMRDVWERMKIIIEPSCAVPLAALIKQKEKYANKKIGLILSGGNVDLDNLPF